MAHCCPIKKPRGKVISFQQPIPGLLLNLTDLKPRHLQRKRPIHSDPLQEAPSTSDSLPRHLSPFTPRQPPFVINEVIGFGAHEHSKFVNPDLFKLPMYFHQLPHSRRKEA
jgi:hypothetical protein